MKILLIFLLCMTSWVWAGDYPNKPVRILIPYPPGELSDIFAREIASVLSKNLGQQFIIDNRSGGSGQIGMKLLKESSADGYTIGVAQRGNLTVLPHTIKGLPYEPLTDFVGIALIATNYQAVVANPNTPFKNAKEMIEWAKHNRGALTLATNGEGGAPHLAFELFASMSRITFLHVPYKGSTQAMLDVMGGQVQIGMGSITPVLPHISSGKLRLIGVTSPSRIYNNIELPVLGDTVPGYHWVGWLGFISPAGTPGGIIKILNREINRVSKQLEISDRFRETGNPISTNSPEYFDKLIKADYIKTEQIVRNAGLIPK
jgi:tripartite-type tricarboxylate transporter receptor subunit TctC